MPYQQDLTLTITDLAARRGEIRIFSDLSFGLKAGEAAIVTGRNGSGKSTLLRVLAGLLAKELGEIVLTPNGGIPFHEYCHYLGHPNALKPALSVEENLTFWQKFCGQALMGPDEALEAVGLPGIGYLPAACLSAGQKRRVAIARLLVAKKQIWLVDEPTAALDKKSEEQFAGLCRDHMARGGMVIAATHQPLNIGEHHVLEMGKVK